MFFVLQLYFAGPLYFLPVTVLLYFLFCEGLGHNLHIQGFLQIPGFLCGVLMDLPHFALINISQRFLFLLYAIMGFSWKVFLFMQFSTRCLCLFMILFIFGLAGLKVRMSGILLFHLIT